MKEDPIWTVYARTISPEISIDIKLLLAKKQGLEEGLSSLSDDFVFKNQLAIDDLMALQGFTLKEAHDWIASEREHYLDAIKEVDAELKKLGFPSARK